MDDSNYILKTTNLSVGYSSKKGHQVIASNIDFSLKRGQLVGLVGANGIGKSTLLRTLAQIQPPLGGHVFINGKDISHQSIQVISKALSLVLTDPIASKNLSVFELVSLGRQPYTDWIGNLTSKDLDIVQTALEQANIEILKDKKCYELSDGQLQKVMIARALAQDTDLIILDEPTSHLDMYHKAYILKLLKTLAQTTGKTILFSSHEIDLAIQLCDVMIVMTKDQVLFDEPCTFISNGIFNDLFPQDLIAFDQGSGTFRIRK